jgi:hypothetical protein
MRTSLTAILAFRQSLSFTHSTAAPVMSGVRIIDHPQFDFSMFKVFPIPESFTSEIRGEFSTSSIRRTLAAHVRHCDADPKERSAYWPTDSASKLLIPRGLHAANVRIDSGVEK